jgi:hypothetical protein
MIGGKKQRLAGWWQVPRPTPVGSRTGEPPIPGTPLNCTCQKHRGAIVPDRGEELRVALRFVGLDLSVRRAGFLQDSMNSGIALLSAGSLDSGTCLFAYSSQNRGHF